MLSRLVGDCWCRWLRAHDPSTINDVLESALHGADKKAALAAAGTLLAATDALAQARNRCLPRNLTLAVFQTTRDHSVDGEAGSCLWFFVTGWGAALPFLVDVSCVAKHLSIKAENIRHVLCIAVCFQIPRWTQIMRPAIVHFFLL